MINHIHFQASDLCFLSKSNIRSGEHNNDKSQCKVPKNDNFDSFQSHIHVHVLTQTQTQTENEAGCTDLQIIRVERDIYIGGMVSNVYEFVLVVLKWMLRSVGQKKLLVGIGFASSPQFEIVR